MCKLDLSAKVKGRHCNITVNQSPVKNQVNLQLTRLGLTVTVLFKLGRYVRGLIIIKSMVSPHRVSAQVAVALE